MEWEEQESREGEELSVGLLGREMDVASGEPDEPDELLELE